MKELKISNTITARSASLNRYLSEISKIPLLTTEEEVELTLLSSKGDLNAREKLVKSNLRFVVSVAKIYGSGDVIKFEDLINEGNHGLIEAAEIFDPSRGFKFISYAVWHIRKYMLKYLTNNSRHIRLPQNKVVSLSKLRQIESDLAHRFEREATSDEIIEEYANVYSKVGERVDIQQLLLAMNADLNPSSLSADADDEDMYNPLNYINGDEDGTDHLTNKEDILNLLLRYLNILSPNDKEIVMLKLGFHGECLTFSEIGTMFDRTAESIRGRYNKSIRRMRWKMASNNVNIDNFF